MGTLGIKLTTLLAMILALSTGVMTVVASPAKVRPGDIPNPPTVTNVMTDSATFTSALPRSSGNPKFTNYSFLISEDRVTWYETIKLGRTFKWKQLLPSRKYFAKSRAWNSVGYGESPDISFTTKAITVNNSKAPVLKGSDFEVVNRVGESLVRITNPNLQFWRSTLRYSYKNSSGNFVECARYNQNTNPSICRGTNLDIYAATFAANTLSKQVLISSRNSVKVLNFYSQKNEVWQLPTWSEGFWSGEETSKLSSCMTSKIRITGFNLERISSIKHYVGYESNADANGVPLTFKLVNNQTIEFDSQGQLANDPGFLDLYFFEGSKLLRFYYRLTICS